MGIGAAGGGCRGSRGLKNQQEIRLEIAGRVIAGVHWPCAGGFPVIALHGWLDNAATWSKLLPLLDEMDVYALDLAGHGRSDHRPASVPYHFIDNVADVIAVADALGLEKFGLLGHSLGASVATLVAGTVPQRISSVICLEGFGALTTPAEQAPGQLERSLQRYLQPTSPPSRYASVEAAAQARTDATGLGSDAARLLAQRGTRDLDGDIVWSADPRLRYDSPLRLTEEQVCAFIARIETPVLLVRAAGGLDFPQQVYQRRARACRSLQIVEVEGEHHLHLEAATVAGVAAAIASFQQDL
ncbi:MAG: alpha/beta hydrolase [Gammaproteobacteria bacterium]|nr:alpha/beta hydrolase [Gammaproteobacteria bacterium]NNF60996.1 alpha/beta hydrolase [Gammaproteobacteria bacterium]NNM21090.1 alpha/beta hydrolase [Gammaproteobacteria bacterium]